MTDMIVLAGLLKPDGTLELDCKPNLPPGPVRVTVEAMPRQHSIWKTLEKIWVERQAMGLPGRTREEIDAEIRELRAEWDEDTRETK